MNGSRDSRTRSLRTPTFCRCGAGGSFGHPPPFSTPPPPEGTACTDLPYSRLYIESELNIRWNGTVCFSQSLEDFFSSETQNITSHNDVKSADGEKAAR